MDFGHNISELQRSLFSARDSHSCLCPKATRNYKSQIKAITGTDGHIKMPVAICVGGGGSLQNIVGIQIYLVTISLNMYRILLPEMVIVCCGQRPQHF